MHSMHEDLNVIENWEQNCYYLVEAGFYKSSPIYKCVFFSGYLHKGTPGDYNLFVVNLNDGTTRYNDAIYLKVIRKLTEESELGYTGDLVSDQVKEVS